MDGNTEEKIEQGPEEGGSGEESACQSRDTGDRFSPWVGKIPWRRK